MNTLVPETALEGGLLGRVQYWFACSFVIGWTAFVATGLFNQLGLRETPCPLCVVQRMFMLLAAVGAGYVIRRALSEGAVTGRDYMTGWGMALVAVTGGSVAAGRQTLLHALPGDGGHGSAPFGLHVYVWAWILFTVSAVAIGIVLALAHATADRAVPAARPGPHRAAGTFALGFLGVVIAVSAAAVFLDEGFHWFLPEEPTRHRSFLDVGLPG
ncbi:disulfide bond formation protein B [Streptomyces sp. NPDC054904]|uniref:disulfide bond formation protein B n=1 Tax=unclassified Streptomyces TaxID=2593676 RepID=UPI002481C9A2|nr:MULTISPECIES: disulfide bond formation protein B [unclassified Streptomyces]MDA5281944.1 disulfide bond formation protein B [Streptomyces sp. Isolate_45]MDX2392939.1 disulfide bond formation protein B [Streptomyces sp. DK15]